jgi:hypothetical protein
LLPLKSTIFQTNLFAPKPAKPTLTHQSTLFADRIFETKINEGFEPFRLGLDGLEKIGFISF